MKVFIVCDTCRIKHSVRPRSREAEEFRLRHPRHQTRLVPLFGLLSWFYESLFEQYIGWLAYAPNANIKQALGGDAAITLTLASLAQAAARESTAIDNSTNLYLDALLRLHCKLQTGTPASDKAINVYAYGSEDGTNYTDNATGTDAALTLRSPTNLRWIGSILTPDGGLLTYKSHPLSIAAAFGGFMPSKWGIVVENRTNIALSATEGDHAKAYNGIYATST